MSVDAFNKFDKTFRLPLISAVGERFLERGSSPLPTLARRPGYLHLTGMSGEQGLTATIDGHLMILDAVLEKIANEAREASDELIAFSISLIDELDGTIDPILLGASLSESAPDHVHTAQTNTIVGSQRSAGTV